MILSYGQLYSQVNLIDNYFEGQVYIQKIYSTACFICISLRGAGQTRYLYFGRGSNYEGIWLGEEKPESFLRKRDTFLEYLRKHVSSSSLAGLDIDEKDRIISLKYYKWGHENQFSIFYNGRELFFSNYFFDENKKKMILFKSWKKEIELIPKFDFNHFDEVGRKDLSDKSEKSIKNSIDDLIEIEREKARKSQSLKKNVKFLKRKIKNISSDLEKVLKFKDLQELAQTELDFSKYPLKTKFFDIKFSFKEKEHFKRRNQIFEKSKALKKAVSILEERLSSAQNKLEGIDKVDNFENKLETIKPYWNTRKKVETKKTEAASFKVFKFEGYTIGLGTSSKSNDELRKNWAKKDDIWFHLDGDTSPHAIVKLNGKSLDFDLFSVVGSLILEYSNLNYTEANLIYTNVKNLKGIPGKAGAVNYKKEKRIKVEKNNSWRDFIKSD